MKLKKSFKIFLISLAVLIALFIGLVVAITVKELNQEEILEQEIINYSNKDLVKDDFTIEVKTTGDCAYVEESVKKYYKELSDNMKTINYYLNNKKIHDVLYAKNLEKDRPDYTESKNTIKIVKNKVNKSIDNIINLCSEKKIKHLLDKDKLDDPDYYYDLYLQLIYTKQDKEDLKEVENTVKKYSKDLNAILNKANDILNFLQKNNSYITYENDEVTFNSSSKLKEYNKLVDEINEMINKVNNGVDSENNNKV